MNYKKHCLYQNIETITNIHRNVHIIKWASNFLDITPLAQITNSLENILIVMIDKWITIIPNSHIEETIDIIQNITNDLALKISESTKSIDQEDISYIYNKYWKNISKNVALLEELKLMLLEEDIIENELDWIKK